MPKKATERQKNRVMDLLNGMEPIFSISNFDRTLKIVSQDELHNDREVAAKVTFDDPYQTIIIRLYPYFFTLTLEEQRKTMLHELCHVFTLPSKTLTYDILDGTHVTRDQVHKANEKQTSQIENILDRLLDDRAQGAKKAYANYLKT